MTVWTPERTEDLRRLRLVDGLDYDTIAQRMGLTRGQVIGKAQRIGLRNASAARRHGCLNRDKSEVTRRAKRRAVTLPEVPGACSVASDEQMGASAPTNHPAGPSANPAAHQPLLAPDPCWISLLELKAHHCRWPDGGRGSYTFCGARRTDGSSYCARHRAMALRPELNGRGH